MLIINCVHRLASYYHIVFIHQLVFFIVFDRNLGFVTRKKEVSGSNGVGEVGIRSDWEVSISATILIDTESSAFQTGLAATSRR